MTSDPYNKYKQIATSYFRSALEYNVHRTSKWIEYVDVTTIICTLIGHGFLQVISVVRTSTLYSNDSYVSMAVLLQ